MVEQVEVSIRASSIEYAIRDVVVPAIELEKQGHDIIRLNIGDPLAYDGLPTPIHMIDEYKNALDRQNNGYGPSYGLDELRKAISLSECSKGWNCNSDNVYVTHGVTEALQVFCCILQENDTVLAPGLIIHVYGLSTNVWCKTVEYRLKSSDNWGIDLEDIRRKMNDSVKLLVLINPNNPTGNIATRLKLNS